MPNNPHHDEYIRMAAADPFQVECRVCGKRGSKSHLDRHHPRGRHGENLLSYFYACKLCHRWIHENPDEATERGWLEPNRHTDK